MDLRKDVEDDAAGFIVREQDIFRQALIDGKSEAHEVEYDNNGEFHSFAVDRSYTLQDAAYIVEECRNLEEDRGLWDSLEPIEAVKAQAAFSYGNDVHERVSSLYESLFEDYQDTLADFDERRQELEDARDDGTGSGEDGALSAAEVEELDLLDPEKVNLDERAAQEAIESFIARHTNNVEPCEKGSDEEAFVLRRWLTLNDRVGLRGGYPLGGSYIDARCGVGYGMPDEKDYVDYDHLAADRVPHMRGANREQVEAYIKKTWPTSKRRKKAAR
jgi:hypothetical protein